MADFTITSKDYVDLKETLSEKNIINTVGGKEYVVVSIEGTELDNRTINPNTLSQVFASSPYVNQTAKYNPDMICSSGRATLKSIFGFYYEVDWARTETLYFSGKYTFTTKEVITDKNSISCSFSIDYTKSGADALNNDLYNIDKRTSFFGYGGQFPNLENESDEHIITNEFIPSEMSTVQAGLGLNFGYAKMPSITEYCNAKIINETASSTRVEVSYRFKIWAGWATDNQKDNTVLAVNNIKISTVANTVDTEEVSFLYQGNRVNTERKYELETNELFQTTLDERDETKLSYQTYEKITDAFDTDRRIITFDLLNPVKVKVDDSIKYTEGRNQERYLDTDDEFSIYDEHNKYMGDFKVIQSNPVWDGAYHKIITAILIE